MPTAAATPQSIAWHRRMEARVALGVGLLVALSLGAIVFATTQAVTERSLARTAEDLEVARAAFYQSLDSRADSVAALTRLVTTLPIFRAHLTDTRLSGDLETVSAMADGYRNQLNAQFCIVTDANGRWLANPGWPHPTADRSSVLTGIQSASGGRSRRSIATVHDQLFLVVSEPARFAEEILGTLTVGYVLDDEVAKEFAQVTHCEVTLVSGGHVCASSLHDEARAALAVQLALASRSRQDAAMSSQVQQLGGDRYIGGTFPVSLDRAADNGNQLVLLQDWRPTQQFVDQLIWEFIAAAAAIFAFALVGGVVFSQRLSLPLREIASAAGDIASGNLTRQLPVRGSVEATTVAIAFNNMSSSLRTARERLLHDAIHDHLTELPNRVLFMERLHRSIRRRYRHPEYTFAVLFVDLDRFKTVNDSLGRRAGDQLLVEIARRLAEVLRRDDTVSRPAVDVAPDADNTLARLGGDEFTILLEDIRDPSDAVRVAERIQESASRPVSLDGQEVFTTASVGIAICTPAHGSGEELVRDADLAMQRAKASGGDRSAIYDATMHHLALERLQLESDLRRAVERREFVLHYQPIVAFRGRKVVGVEALVRWQHPDRGLLMPAAFLHVAEETGIIGRIDEWALGEACGQAARWQKLFPGTPPVSVSVNVSAAGFGRPDLVNQVAQTLRDTGLDSRSLRLEITESVAMADAERTRTILIELKALGVRISLDDFGTGYSSFSYLQRFPVDTLKIDRSFVEGLHQNDECREIIRTILNLARTLRLDVIAEGTETINQVDYLEGLDCEYGQGYFFSKPVPFSELGRLLAPAELEESYRTPNAG